VLSRFELIIFDCDDVLVDSERLAVIMESRILTEIGWPLSPADVIERFVGRTSAAMKAEIEVVIGRPVDWWVEFEAPIRQIYERELTTVDGVNDVLRGLSTPVCVATSSSRAALEFKLGLTGLLDRFEGRMFSSDDVTHGKPSPEIFLFAAQELDTAPSRCAVIEDSASGVEAGVAAGMTVFAYSGGVTSAARLEREGVTLFNDMRLLPALLNTD
jgi:HAD superfamily hydrolase (TIGR01509 family)